MFELKPFRVGCCNIATSLYTALSELYAIHSEQVCELPLLDICLAGSTIRAFRHLEYCVTV